jgi:2-polyprenyl-6-methoxyphenol hydroxylase-like FAD-dependent oxidoreductase
MRARASGYSSVIQSHVVIVGAGPAGAALSFLLARRSVGVTLLERQTDFAREFRGEALMPTGVEAITQMGLREELDELPHTEITAVEFFLLKRGPLRLSFDSAADQVFRIRMVSQPQMLEMMVAQAARFPSFHLERRAIVRDLIYEGARVVGVGAETSEGLREFRGALVIGADGRSSVLRKRAGLHEARFPQTFDVMWGKVPLPDSMSDRATARAFLNKRNAALAFPAADGQMQFGWLIEKGSYGALHARGIDAWFAQMAGELPADMATHLLANRNAISHPFLLDVICDRLVRWTAPGLLLIGDAAHPMSPVGGQGINIALRDAVIAANHLCPALVAAAGPDAIDAAARSVQEERLPEVEGIQKRQQMIPPYLLGSTWLTRAMLALGLQLLTVKPIARLTFRAARETFAKGIVPVRLQA